MATSQLIGDIVQSLLPAASLLLVTLIGWATRELARFIAQRVQNEALAAAMTRLNNTVYEVVLDLEQTVVGKLKDVTSPGGDGAGGITEAEAADVKAAALAKVKALIGPEGLKRLLYVMAGDQKQLDALIDTKVEAAVRLGKAGGGK